MKKLLEKIAKALLPIIWDLLQPMIENWVENTQNSIALRNQDSLEQYKQQLKKEIQDETK
jgi:hypothetical protein